MKTTAALLVETGSPLELAELTLPALQPGQVLVEIAYSGVCHTQLLECRGYRGEDRYLPHCLGHEGSGVVVDVGAEISRCKVGDRVILSWIKSEGADVPGCEYDWNGRKVNAGGVTTFAQHAVVSENRLTVISNDIDLKVAALLGCAIPTGMGAVLNSACLKAGQSLAVFGTGGIGLFSVAAAAISGAIPVIAIDVSEDRLAIARQLGAQYTLNASSCDPIAEIHKICPAGVDLSIEASGRPEVMQQALACVRNQGGATVIVGNARHGETMQLDPKQLNMGKRLIGSWGGDNVPSRDFPRYQQMILDKKFDVNLLISRPRPLREINEALADLESRSVARPLIAMDME